MLFRIKLYIIVQTLQLIPRTRENIGMKGRVSCCVSIVHLYKINTKKDSVFNIDHAAGWRRTASVAPQTRGAQLECCSERGKARHFDVDVSDVDVAGNLG